jgi:hypothetical protein
MAAQGIGRLLKSGGRVMRDNRNTKLEPLESRKLFAGTVAVSGGVPLLSSNPSAAVKVYLDFDGQAATSWNGLSVPVTPAYDTDGAVTTFNTIEQADIREMFARVAEKFSPFNVDVTTTDPGSYADRSALKVVIGGDGAWVGFGDAGKAVTGSFYNASSANVVYVFSKNVGSSKYLAEAISKYVGRAFGLEQNYTTSSVGGVILNQGNAQAAPVMGVSYFAERGLWWNGNNALYNNTVNEIAVVAGSSNGFGYRTDDHGNSAGTATAMAGSGGTFNAAGVIETVSDSDYFSFTTTGGSVTLNGVVAQYGAMLNLKLQVFNASSQLAGSADTASLGESFTLNLAAGTYTVVVAGHGWASGGAGQGSGADVGQYTLRITGPVVSAPAAPVIEKAVAYSPSLIKLQWSDPLSNETGFVIDRATDSTFTQNVVAAIVGANEKTLDVTGLSTGTKYYFRVHATTATGNSPNSTLATATTASPGDVNLDGSVTGDDYTIIDANLGITPQPEWAWVQGDANLDGVVTSEDYLVIAAHATTQNLVPLELKDDISAVLT